MKETLEALVAKKRQLEESKMELYRKVQDFSKADAITTEKAIRGMKEFDIEIKATQKKD